MGTEQQDASTSHRDNEVPREHHEPAHNSILELDTHNYLKTFPQVLDDRKHPGKEGVLID